MEEENVSLAREIVAAWERGDYTSADWAHPDIEYVHVGGPGPGTWHGLEGMAQGWRDFLGAWDDWQAEAEEYRALGDDRVLVLLRGSGRGKASGLSVEGLGVRVAPTVLHFRDGKVSRLVVYWDRELAFAELGIESAPVVASPSASELMQRLEILVGSWRMEAAFPDGVGFTDARGEVVFEWMGEERFLLQRWTVDYAAAPDGLAIIGYDEGRSTLLQHYFDERGVARIYEMSLEDGVWTLTRTAPDFSALDFSQRFTGTIDEPATIIAGRWETSRDGASWETDFELTYTKL